jgi:hypothetical protein
MKAQNLAVILAVMVVTALATHYLWPLPAPAPRPTQAQASKPTPPTFQPSTLMAPAMNRPPGPPPSLITPDIRARFPKARLAAFAANPALKKEEDDLTKQRMAMMKRNPPPSPGDQKAFIAKWEDHAQKMRAAMAKADPTLQPIFADLDARIKARQQQIQQQQAHFAPTPGNSPPPPVPSPSPTASPVSAH